MHIQNIVVVLLWSLFLLIWIVSASTAKREARDLSTRKMFSWWRSLDVVLNIALISIVPIQHFFAQYLPTFGNPLILWLGVVLCGIGITVMIWARWYLGKNWGAPMAKKENPELVTNGPYRFVRHPIYSGGLLALLGTGLVVGLWYGAFFLFFVFYFVLSARKEERAMTEMFGAKYIAYKHETKMFIPFGL